MSGEPYKIRNTMQYTEIVYYAGDGVEVGRERVHDDHTYDASSPEPMTEQEIDDWIQSGEDEDDGDD